MNYPPNIDPKKETLKITAFINKTFKNAKKTEAVIAVSGGVDSSTSLFLTARALRPQNITCLFLPAKTTDPNHWEHVRRSCKVARIPQENILTIPIGGIIQKSWNRIKHSSPVKLQEKATPNRKKMNHELAYLNRLRLANIAARTRMIVIYDQAKLHDALVVGTENHSEHLLGYYTRFGDEASDIEPVKHLYKTQLLELAKYLKIPKEVIEKPPTAGLWAGQTDEIELGFSYEEADPILYLHYEQQKSPKEIVKVLTSSTQRKTKEVEQLVQNVLSHCQKMKFKHVLPYVL